MRTRGPQGPCPTPHISLGLCPPPPIPQPSLPCAVGRMLVRGGRGTGRKAVRPSEVTGGAGRGLGSGPPRCGSESLACCPAASLRRPGGSSVGSWALSSFPRRRPQGPPGQPVTHPLTPWLTPSSHKHLGSTYCVPGPGGTGLQVSRGTADRGPGGSGSRCCRAPRGRRGTGPLAESTASLLSLQRRTSVSCSGPWGQYPAWPT